MTKSEFADWKRHPVTQQVFSMLQARVSEIKDQIVAQAAYEPQARLALLAGAVAAYHDLLNIEFEETGVGN